MMKTSISAALFSAAVLGSPVSAGFTQIGGYVNSLKITQYASNSGGGVRYEYGTTWASIGFTEWVLSFGSSGASMTASFGVWGPMSASFASTNVCSPATQSTQRIEGDIGFRVDRDYRFTLNGSYAVSVRRVSDGALMPTGATVSRNTQYLLHFEDVSVLAGGSASSSGVIALEWVAPPCLGDVTGNGAVDGVDLAAVLGTWGTSGLGEFVTDINNDGLVGGADLGILLNNWGTCPN